MLVHECNSCQKISRSVNSLPAGWVLVTLKGVLSKDLNYELCTECSKMPMTFGKITGSFAGQAVVTDGR